MNQTMTTTRSKRVLILGARGRFGLAAVRAFAAAGWQVIGQLRAGAAEPDVPGVRWVQAAPQDTAALAQAAQGAATVVHALNPHYTRWQTDAMPMLEAALCIAQCLQARLMLPGNVYNFGAGMPACLDEHTPQSAHTRKGRIRVAMEQRMQHAARSGEVCSVVIRAGDFFGSGTGNWFDEVLAKDLRRGRMTYPGALDVPTAWAYLPDLASTFVRVAEKALAAPAALAPFEALHFQGYGLSGQDWVEQMTPVARENGWIEAGQALRTGRLPWPLIRLGGAVVPLWRELAEMRYLWQTPHALVGTRLAGLIGPEPRTALPVAVRGALASLGLTGAPVASACAAAQWA